VATRAQQDSRTFRSIVGLRNNRANKGQYLAHDEAWALTAAAVLPLIRTVHLNHFRIFAHASSIEFLSDIRREARDAPIESF
jgi:hypothetical protein